MKQEGQKKDTATAMSGAGDDKESSSEQEMEFDDGIDIQQTKEPEKVGAKKDVASSESVVLDEGGGPPEKESKAVDQGNVDAPPVAAERSSVDNDMEIDQTEEEKAIPVKKRKPSKPLKRSASASSVGKRREPKPKKRKKSKPPKRSPEEVEQKRQEIIATGRKDLEEEKAATMDRLPEEYRARFGEIGFASYSREWYPILILNPYDVSPGVRDEWKERYEHAKAQAEKHGHQEIEMEFLHYWYGAMKKNDYYGFLAPSKIVKLDDGMKKEYHMLPKAVQKKVDNGKKLLKKDLQHVRKIDEMNEDLKKSPDDRKRGIWPFQEDFETDGFLDVMMGTEDGEVASTDEEDLSLDAIPFDSSESESDLSDEEKVKTAPSGAAKTKKKGRPKKAVAKQAQPKSLSSASGDVHMSDIGDDEVSADDAKDSDLPEPSSSSDDDDDEDYAELGRKKQPSHPKKERCVGEKKAGAKKKAVLDRKRTKGGKKGKSAKKILEEERERYLESLHKFRQPLEALSSAVKNKESAAIEASMKELLESAGDMAGSFIQESGVVPLVKSVKALFKKNKEDLSTVRDLFQLLKTTHAAKKSQIPDVPDLKELTKKWRRKSMRPKKPEALKAEPLPAPPKKGSVRESIEPSNIDKPDTPVVKSESAPREIPPPPRSVPARTMSEPSRPVSQVSVGSALKSEKKSFSLGSFVRPAASSSSKPKNEEVSSRPKDPRLSVEKTKTLPQWLTSPPDQDDDFASNQDRTFAIEFIQAAASRLPADKVNRDYFARSLEAAIYKWANEKITVSWSDDYWLKVHSLVGAICGKRGPGTLVKQIMDGEFDSARALVMLDDNALFQSFDPSYY